MNQQFRLRERRRFEQVRDKGHSWAHPLGILVVLANDLSQLRCGFSASRRVGGAVKRNRARRLLREAVRLQMAQLLPGHDLVFIARPAINEAGFSEVMQAVTILLRRARLLQAPDPAGPSSGDPV